MTILCSEEVAFPLGSIQVLETSMTLTAGGAGALRSFRNGVSWCAAAQTAAEYIASGTAGYGVTGMPGFTGYSFGAMSVDSTPSTCPNGCSGSIVNGTCTLPCNTGAIARGDNTRVCTANGTYAGTPLICDNGAPVLNDRAVSIPENQPPFTAVGAPFPSRLASGADGTGTILFEIVSGNTGGAFSMDACTGQVRVADADAIDFETVGRNSFNLRVRASITGSLPIAETFADMTITVTNTK
jgi:hypothetical protein